MCQQHVAATNNNSKKKNKNNSRIIFVVVVSFLYAIQIITTGRYTQIMQYHPWHQIQQRRCVVSAFQQIRWSNTAGSSLWGRNRRISAATTSVMGRIPQSQPQLKLNPFVVQISTVSRLYSSTASSSSSTSSSSSPDDDETNQKRGNKKINDQSAASQSRPSFRNPKYSPDDSQPAVSSAKLSWNQLGLWTELVTCLENEMSMKNGPTTVQQMVIPTLLAIPMAPSSSDAKQTMSKNSSSKHVAFLAATGSGKTLAYALPVMQLLKQEEVFGPKAVDPNTTALMDSPFRRKQRPRAIIMAPTRELCLQITSICKQLSHSIKLSVLAVTGGTGLATQRQRLEGSPVDILVATPGRLYQHVQAGTITLTNKHLRYVVLDEMDTMIEQGFAHDIQQLLYPVLYHARPHPTLEINVDTDVVDSAPSIFMTSATLTQSIQIMIGETQKDLFVNAKKHFTKPATTADATKTRGALFLSEQQKLPQMILPKMKVIKAPGLHKTVPRLQQVFVDTAAIDKISLLTDILSNHQDKLQSQSVSSKNSNASARKLTMIFCNTARSCQAVEFALKEANFDNVLSYHGELNSAVRSDNLNLFRLGYIKSSNSHEAKQQSLLPTASSAILVCTDLAARGLDIPSVDHVIMFDFPLNALDYLHRSGRTARGGALSGKVTALVSKRDQVLANAISQAVQRGDPLDGLSSRKTDYLPGGRLNTGASTAATKRVRPQRNTSRISSFGARTSDSKKYDDKRGTTRTSGRSAKPKPKDTTMRKQRAR